MTKTPDKNEDNNPITIDGNKETLTSDLSIKNLLDYEQKRYKRKGFGLVVAIIIASSYFYFYPKILFNFFSETKIENPGLVYFLVTFFIHETVYCLTNFYYFVIYSLNSNFFERYKVSPDPWPWQADKAAWGALLMKTIKQTLINHSLILVVMLPNLITNDCPYRLDNELPSLSEILAQLVFSMLCEDFAFYWAHRFLHSDKLYAKIHKMHHEYKQTISITTEYAHPIEYLAGNILPTNLGALLLGKRMHFITYLTNLTMMTHESIDGHCGYDFSWSPHRLLPLSIGAEFHIFHHLKFKGNYSSLFTIWDRIGNTVNKAYLDYYELKDKKDKTKTKEN